LRILNRIPAIGALARWRLKFSTYTPPTPVNDRI
jgi:hypothetical protein